jgi:hypothetical protein
VRGHDNPLTAVELVRIRELAQLTLDQPAVTTHATHGIVTYLAEACVALIDDRAVLEERLRNGVFTPPRKPRRQPTMTEGVLACPECGLSFGVHGLRVHRAAAHGYVGAKRQRQQSGPEEGYPGPLRDRPS